jgi:hypothetical protein
LLTFHIFLPKCERFLWLFSRKVHKRNGKTKKKTGVCPLSIRSRNTVNTPIGTGSAACADRNFNDSDALIQSGNIVAVAGIDTDMRVPDDQVAGLCFSGRNRIAGGSLSQVVVRKADTVL